MRRILIFANTHYQIILAIQMKLTIFSEDDVTLAISNHSGHADTVCERLQRRAVFQNCVFVESKGMIHNRSQQEKLKEFFQIIYGKKNRYSFYLKDIENKYFDEMLFYNLEIDTYGIYSILAEYNHKLVFSSYEEGILSYENIFYDSLKFKWIRFLRRCIGKSAILDNYHKFYCVYPEMYAGRLNTVQIPQISTSDNRMQTILADIFRINRDVDYKKYKYIFFESIYETEGRGIGETEILMQLAEKVGKDNILVKKHPRSTIHIFEEKGIAVDTNSSAPFEAIQLNNDMSDCIFVAATSGSVLSVNSIVDKPSKVILFYPLTAYQNIPELCTFTQHVGDVVAAFQKKGQMRHVTIVKSFDEMLEIK